MNIPIQHITRKLFGFLILIAVLVLNACSSSRRTLPVEEGWDLLGEQKVNFVRDRDAITVYNTNRYTAIRFKVEKKDIILNDLKVVYENGDKLSPTIGDKIMADQFSRVIELGPEGKLIRSVEFKFRSTGSVLKGRANVLIFGKRYTQPY